MDASLSAECCMSLFLGTFRTWRDVRLESVNRLKADMISAEKFQKWFELPKADLAALGSEGEGK
jgi:hypothetical protein